MKIGAKYFIDSIQPCQWFTWLRNHTVTNVVNTVIKKEHGSERNRKFKNEIGIETRKYQYFNSDLVAGNDGREWKHKPMKFLWFFLVYITFYTCALCSFSNKLRNIKWLYAYNKFHLVCLKSMKGRLRVKYE